MVTFRTDTSAVVDLGGEVVTMAADVDQAAGDVAGIPCLAGPPATAAALRELAQAYGQTTQRLHDDVVALGLLTQAAGAAYAEVETAAAQLDSAALGATGATAGLGATGGAPSGASALGTAPPLQPLPDPGGSDG